MSLVTMDCWVLKPSCGTIAAQKQDIRFRQAYVALGAQSPHSFHHSSVISKNSLQRVHDARLCMQRTYGLACSGKNSQVSVGHLYCLVAL
jgi:hypothetical protein